MSKPLSPTTTALMRAKALIEDTENWCQHRPVRYDSAGRERVCAIGALQKAAHPFHRTPEYVPAKQSLDRASASLYGVLVSTIRVNDCLGHAAVMEVFDLAIQESLSADHK